MKTISRLTKAVQAAIFIYIGVSLISQQEISKEIITLLGIWFILKAIDKYKILEGMISYLDKKIKNLEDERSTNQ